MSRSGAIPTATAGANGSALVALPILRSETLTAQSAQIDTVSGATYTSDAYIRSLQSAIDAAHLAGATALA